MKSVSELLKIDNDKKLTHGYAARELSFLKRKPVKKNKVKKGTNKISFYHRLVLTMNYEQFLLSKYWLLVRKMVLKRDNYTCTFCGVSSNLQVHHTTYKHHKYEHKHLNELLTLCSNCHYKYHIIHEVK